MMHGVSNYNGSHNTPGSLYKSQNLEQEGHVNLQRLNLRKFSVKHGHVASASSTTGRKRYEGLVCSLFLKVYPSFLGKSIVCDEGQYEKGTHSYLTWGPQRATNQLDQIPPLQDGSESYFFRHGHQGLLSMQLQSPMSSSTTQKDSYQLPRHACQPLRGVKHERRDQKEPSRQKRETGLPGGIVDCLVAGYKGEP